MESPEDWYVLVARGKRITFDPHALDGQGQEARRRPVTERHLVRTLESPDTVVRKRRGHEARKWLGQRTVIVRYEEFEERIHVYGISATRRRLAP